MVARRLPGTPAQHEREAQARPAVSEEPGQQQGPAAGGVDVVDHRTDRRPGAGLGQVLSNRLEANETPGRVAFVVLQGGDDARRTAQLAEERWPRPERRRASVRPAAPDGRGHPSPPATLRQLVTEPGLAGPGPARHDDQRASALGRRHQRVVELAQLASPPHESISRDLRVPADPGHGLTSGRSRGTGCPSRPPTGWARRRRRHPAVGPGRGCSAPRRRSGRHPGTRCARRRWSSRPDRG
jgi:hypothetical protein